MFSQNYKKKSFFLQNMKSLACIFLVLLLACQTAPKEKQADKSKIQETEKKEVTADKNAFCRCWYLEKMA